MLRKMINAKRVIIVDIIEASSGFHWHHRKSRRARFGFGTDGMQTGHRCEVPRSLTALQPARFLTALHTGGGPLL
jgi:hypothetical protein